MPTLVPPSGFQTCNRDDSPLPRRRHQLGADAAAQPLDVDHRDDEAAGREARHPLHRLQRLQDVLLRRRRDVERAERRRRVARLVLVAPPLPRQREDVPKW